MSERNISTEVNSVTSLPAPTNLSISISSTIDITWKNNDNSSDGGVFVERSDDGGSTFSSISDSLSVGTTSYQDDIPTEQDSATYRIVRSTDHKTSRSNSVSVDIVQPPESLSVDNISNTSATVSWNDINNNEDGYRVLISEDGGNTFTQEGSDLAPDTNSYSITSLSQGLQYVVKIVAFKGSSTPSNSISFITTFDPPQNISSQRSNGFDKGIELGWSIPDTNSGGSVKILRRESGQTSFTEIESLDPSVTTYTDTTFPTRGETYEYKIRRIIQSAFEDSVTTSITTLAKPEIDFTLKNPSVTILKLSFIPPQAESVEVYKSTSSGDVAADYTLLQTLQSAFNGAIVDQDSGNEEDHYRVAAIAGNTKVLSDEVLAEKVGNFSEDNPVLDVEQTLGQYDI